MTDQRRQRLDEIVGEINRLMLTTGFSIGKLLNEAKEICDDLERLDNKKYVEAMTAARLTLDEAKKLEALVRKGEANLTKNEREWIEKLGKQQLERAVH